MLLQFFHKLKPFYLNIANQAKIYSKMCHCLLNTEVVRLATSLPDEESEIL